MISYTYLLVNFFTIIICFVFSFHPRIRFDSYFAVFLKSATIVAIPFLIWDILFTKYGIWWFNTAYTLGITIAKLPLEEWMFFYCIPFSCLFTYYCLTKFFDFSKINQFNKIIVLVSIAVCIGVAFMFPNKTYTFVTSMITICSLLFLQWIVKVDWIGQASLVYCILMLGFFPVNGILTGTGIESPIVNYNPDAILNIRMLTIPIEDVVYGYSMYLLNIYFFYQILNFQKNKIQMC